MSVFTKRFPYTSRSLRGAALLELLIAIALFVSAAGLIMRSMRTAMGRVTDSSERLKAIDLAQSRLAEFSSGLVSLRELQGGVEIIAPWIVETSVQPSAISDFSLVVITVRQDESQSASVDSFIPVTIRQLVHSDWNKIELASQVLEPEV